ncbi:DUF3221 domain-containing protein [Chloroflexota bacterium]
MKTKITTILFLFIIGLSLSSCVGSIGDAKARLGEEFILPVGQSVVITGEDLGINFVDISEDSRCPKGATCVWECRVVALVEISTDGSTQRLELTQPGLTDALSRETFNKHEITYKVEPYPEAVKEISADDYRLLITVRLVPQPLQTEADFTGFITEIHPVGNEDVLGQILVESLTAKLGDKYMVTINDETLIFKQDGENRRQAAFEELETKQKVEVWFTGPIMESFPMQGTAQQVVITE